MKKFPVMLAALALGTVLLGACVDKSGGDGDTSGKGSAGSDTTNPSSRVAADSASTAAPADTPAPR